MNTEPLERLIRTAINKRVEEITEEEVKKAAANVEKRVRESIGQIATAVASHVDYSRAGTDLVVRVRIEKP